MDLVSGVTPAGFIPYSKNQFEDYKARLAAALITTGLDTTVLSSDQKLKDVIVNYADNELRGPGKEEERLRNKISLRFSSTVISTSAGSREFPVINEYRGHHLMRTRYFVKNGESVEIRTIEVVPKDIVITAS